MPKNPSDARRPRWLVIEEQLHQRILSGDYAEGFPGELELADEFGVSRGTMRTALRRLRESGLIVAERGRRPRINMSNPASSYGAIYSLHEIVTASGATQHSTVLDQTIVEAPEISDRLATIESRLFYLKRVRWADSSPIAIDEIWVPASIAAPLCETDFTNTAFYKELRDTCGTVIAGGDEKLTATIATTAQADLLQTPAQAPLLHIERVAHDGVRLIEFRRTCILGSRFTATRPFGTPLTSSP